MDVFRSLRGEDEDETGASINVSYFHRALSKQLQSSAQHDDFAAFHWEVARLCLTLPLLLHNRVKVVGLVMAWCHRADPFSREMIIRLIPELARDLQGVFFDSFPIVVEGLVQLLDPMNVEALEEILTCLAFLLKLMRRTLLENMGTVFGFFQGLLLHQKSYVREFAAQSFSFLLRKLQPQKLSELLDSLWPLLDLEKHAEAGLATLLFQTMRGFSGRLHSQAPTVFAVMLQSWERQGQLRAAAIGRVVEEVVAESRSYCRKNASDLEFIWRELSQKLSSKPTSDTGERMVSVIRCVRDSYFVLRNCSGFFSTGEALEQCMAASANKPAALCALREWLVTLMKTDAEKSVSLQAVTHILALDKENQEATISDVTESVSSLHKAALVRLCSKIFLVETVDVAVCLNLFLCVQELEAFWAQADVVSGMVRKLMQRGFAGNEECVTRMAAVCRIALQWQPRLVSSLVDTAVAVEKRIVRAGGETSALRKLVHACGISRVLESLADLEDQPSSAVRIDAAAFCLKCDTVPEGALWEQASRLLAPHLLSADSSLRCGSLEALGAFASVNAAARVLQRLHAVQTMDYMRQDHARQTVQVELERIGADFAMDKAFAGLVARAYLGCLYVRFAPVGQGALLAIVRFLKQAEAWKVIGEFVALLQNRLVANSAGEAAEDAPDANSMLHPTSDRKVWLSLLKFLGIHAAEAEQFARFLMPHFVSFMAGGGCDEELLVSWLKLFASMSNLRGVAQSEELRKIGNNLLSGSSEAVQVNAVAIVVKLDKKLAAFGNAFEAVVGAHSKKAFGDSLQLLPLDQVEDPVLRSRVVEVLVKVLLPKASHRALSKAAFAFLGKLRGLELDPFVALLFPENVVVSHMIVKLAIDSLKVWQNRALSYSTVYVRLAKAALSNVETSMGGARLAELMLRECAGVSLEELVPTLVEASRIPLGTLAADCSATGPNAWLKLLLTASTVHSLDSFFRKSGAVHAVLECLQIEDSSVVAGEAIMTALQIVSHLIPEDGKGNGRDLHRFQDVMFPLIDLLLDYLEAVVRERNNRLFHSSSRRDVVSLQLSLLSRLVKLLEQSHARRLIDIILPTIVASVQELREDDADQTLEQEQQFVAAVELVQGLVPSLTPELCGGLVQEMLSLLLLVGHRRAMCLPLCVLLEKFVETHLPEVIPACSALANMLSFSQVVIGEVDVNRRLMGLEKASQLVAEMSEMALLSESPHFLVVLQAVLFLCSSSDMAIRDQAVANTVALLKLAHRVHGATSHPPCVDNRIMPWLRKLLATGSRPVLHSVLQVLRQCVVEAPTRFSDLATLLSSSNPAKDYFMVSFDSALTVRISALKVLRRALRQHAFSVETVTHILMPLYQHCLFDLAPQVGSRDDIKAYRAALVLALQDLGRLVPWDKWATIVADFAAKWDEAVGMRRGERVNLHLFCAMVDSFHFESDDPAIEMSFIEGSVVRKLQDNVLEAKEEPKGRRKKLKSKDASKGSRINVQVVVVLVRLLQKLPAATMASFLPAVLRSVCNSLAEQDESIRDATRKTLAKISIALGPKYFGPIVTGLRGALRRGFEIQVLYYSLHHLLSSMRESLLTQPGAVDTLAGPLAALLLEDILGLTAARKEVRQLQATLKEARSTKSFHTFELLAESVTFPSASWNETAFQDMLQPVVDMLQFTKRKKDIVKLREVFDRVVVGLGTNASAQTAAILVYAHGLIADNVMSANNRKAKWSASGKAVNMHADTLAQVEAQRRGALLSMKEDTERTKFLVEKTKREVYNMLMESEDHFGANRVLLAEFGLKLLLSELKKAKANKVSDAAAWRAQFDPFVCLCQSAMEQDNDAMVELALECLCYMLKWIDALPTMEKCAKNIASASLQLLRNTDPTGSLGRSCFLFVTAASKRVAASSWVLSEDETQFVLRLILQELDQMRNFTSSFTLLQGMIAKKVLSSEMYDIMERVSRLAITHQEAHIRQQCAACLVKFLVFYPLTDRKRQHHIDHIVRDLSYAEPIGREAALELLNVAFNKFPPAQLMAMAEIVFVPLVARLANEQERRVRAVCGAAIKVLLSKLERDTKSNLIAVCLDWVDKRDPNTGERHAISVAAMQTLGLFAESGKLPKSDREKALAVLQQAVLAEVEAVAEQSEGEWLQSAAEVQERYCRRDAFVYQACFALERFVTVETSPRIGIALSQLLRPESLCSVLRYAHAWVRASAGRLIDAFFGHQLLAKWSSAWHVQLRDGLFEALSDLECVPNADPALIASLTKNVILSLNARRMGLLHQSQQHQQEPATPSPTTKRLKSLVVADADDREDSNAEADDREDKGPDGNVQDVLARFSRIAGKGAAALKGGLFKGMAAVLVKMSPADAATHLKHLLAPLYVVAPWDQEASGVDKQGDAEARNLALLCEQVLSVVKNHVGPAAFAAAANAVRERASTSERTKKQKQAVAFVTQSVEANRKKLKTIKR